ncbi:hypothetical protein [Pseudomonas fluorescens]|uniref:hypothetical protein n=1 Tax=Pseudomonas fluorescens TaxID=294 RepID=UPI0012428D31|nr:hypothetical protein [Pseudomonas fluorescens]VVP20467.1 hypothetical protein PS898_03802 [Pseudomonas fluorescens]
MKKLWIFLLAVLCSSCAKDHSVPPANLGFLKVERENNGTLYAIHYNSDVNLLDLFGRGMREGAASTMLKCALGEDEDFSITNRFRYSAYGVIDEDDANRTREKFNYVTSAFLRQTQNNGTSQEYLSVDELNSLLSAKQQIPCKVVVTAYGYKPYYSNTMHIPVADLLREINKPRS